MIEYWWQWKYVCTYVTTPIMRAINDTECTCAPPTRNPMSCPSNWPQQIWQHAPTVPTSWLTPLEPYTRALGPLQQVTVKRPSIVHCGPKPPEMMANHPAPISDSSFDSIWSLLQLKGEQHFLNFLNLRNFLTTTNVWDMNFQNDWKVLWATKMGSCLRWEQDHQEAPSAKVAPSRV